MQVAKLFRESGFDAFQSEHYRDAESEKDREIDVLAEARYEVSSRFGVRLLFVVECKSATSKPWVLLATPEAVQVPSRVESNWLDSQAADLLRIPERIAGLVLGGVILGPERAAYAVTSSFRERGSADDSYSAIRGLESAVKYWKDVGPGFDCLLGGGAREWALFRIPLVVVGGPLFSAYLDRAGELQVESVTQGRLRWGSGGIWNRATPIDIVTVGALPAYLATLEGDMRSLGRAVDAKSELARARLEELSTDLEEWKKRQGVTGTEPQR